MGFIKKFLAGRGANASTAKWACIQYLGFKKKYPDLDDRRLLEEIIKFRYKILPDPEAENYILEQLGGVQTLTNLVTLVLKAENRNNSAMDDWEYMLYIELAVQEIIKKRGLGDIQFSL